MALKGIEIEVNGHGSVLRNVFSAVFSKISEDDCCYSSDYEIIVNNEGKRLPQPTRPKDLAELLTGEGTVVTCGRFFCYPAGTSDMEISTFEEFENSPCETVILVIDGFFIETYSKNENYLKDVMGFLQRQNADAVTAEYVCGENVNRTSLEI